jgi:hypothetical protein
MSAVPTTAPAPETASSNPTPSGRDARGRFAKGNPGGPGNPFARRVAALRSALLDSISAEDLAAIVRALIAKAQAGDVAAAKLIFAYVLGKPAQAVDPDRLDSEEWQHFKDTTSMYAEMPRVGMAPQPQLPLNMVRMSRPVMTDLCGRQMKEMLQGPPECQEMTDGDSPPSSNGAQRTEAPLAEEVWAALRDLAAPSANGIHGAAEESDPLLVALRQACLDQFSPSPNGD